MSKTLGINQVPSIVGVINGRIHHFRDDFTLKDLREFVRKLIPSRIAQEVVDMASFNETLNRAIPDNKVFYVFITNSNQLTLRFQMPCFQAQLTSKCAWMCQSKLDEASRAHLKKHYALDVTTSIETRQDMLAIFKENMAVATNEWWTQHRPAYTSKSSEFTYASLLQLFELNKHLNLPRLSSLQHLYDLCPSMMMDEEQAVWKTSNAMSCYFMPFRRANASICVRAFAACSTHKTSSIR